MPLLHGSTLTRRALFGLLVATTVTAGCTPDPRVRGSRPPRGATPGATPTPSAALVALGTQEATMAGWLRGAAVATTTPARWGDVLRALAEGHQAHAEVLSRQQPLVAAGASSPTTPPALTPPAPTPSPSTSPAAPVRGSWAEIMKTLARCETELAAASRREALAATDPALVLLLASLTSYATSAATPGLAPVRGTVQPAAVEVGDVTQARLVLASRLRALAEGLEVGAGQVAPADPLYASGRARLVEVLSARDATLAALAAAGQQLPPPELAYQLPGGFDSPAQVRRTWGALEAAVMQAWARVAAASSGRERDEALQAMVGQTARLRQDATALSWWPGWA